MAQDMPVSFSSFVVSIAQSALMGLGEVKDPTGGGVQPNLAVARDSLDLLAMLREKTKGNLDDEEKQLLDAVIGELGSKFEAATK